MVGSPSYNKKKKSWNTNFKLKTLTFPLSINHAKYSRRKYLIVLFFEDKNSLRQRKVYFGFKQEVGKRKQKGFKSKRMTSVDKFSPRYWEQKLIDGQPNLKKAFEKVLKEEGINDD